MSIDKRHTTDDDLNFLDLIIRLMWQVTSVETEVRESASREAISELSQINLGRLCSAFLLTQFW